MWIILQGEGGVTKKTGKFGFKGGGWGVIEKKSNILNLGIPKSRGWVSIFQKCLDCNKAYDATLERKLNL